MAKHAGYRKATLLVLAGISLMAPLGCALGANRAGPPIYTLADVAETAPLLKYDRAACQRILGNEFFLEEVPGGLKCVRENLDPELQKAMITHRLKYRQLQEKKSNLPKTEFERDAEKIERAVTRSVQMAQERHACPNGSSLGSSETSATIRCETPIFARSGASGEEHVSRAVSSLTSEKPVHSASRPCGAGWTYLEIAPARGDEPLRLCASCPRGELDPETTHELNQDERKFRIAGCPFDRPCVICKHHR